MTPEVDKIKDGGHVYHLFKNHFFSLFIDQKNTIGKVFIEVFNDSYLNIIGFFIKQGFLPG